MRKFQRRDRDCHFLSQSGEIKEAIYLQLSVASSHLSEERSLSAFTMTILPVCKKMNFCRKGINGFSIA